MLNGGIKMIKYISLFSGIGAPEKALEKLNIPYVNTNHIPHMPYGGTFNQSNNISYINIYQI